MSAHRLGILGFGDIARKQHLPSILANPAFELRRASSLAPVPQVEGLETVEIGDDHRPILADPRIDAVVICAPPRAHYALAREALEAGKHVLLEKPPTTTLGELDALARLAAARDLVLFACWHSQYSAAADRARALLRGQRLARMEVVWNENLDFFHRGKRWFWQAGNFGVFDMGINALSLLTYVLPEPLLVRRAELDLRPGDETPIAARLVFELASGAAADLRLETDWRAPEPDRRMRIETAAGMVLEITDSGRRLARDGEVLVETPNQEYDLMYRRFAALLAAGISDVQQEPLRLVLDALAVGGMQGRDGSKEVSA